MEVRAPKNGYCTFNTTGVCKCKKEKTVAKMANEVSKQTNESIQK